MLLERRIFRLNFVRKKLENNDRVSDLNINLFYVSMAIMIQFLNLKITVRCDHLN